MPEIYNKKIIHVDMDAFYASVEQRDRPELRGRPVVVGGSPQSRAVVCSASYEARQRGVRSAMSCAQAKRLCPEAIFITPSFDKYVKVSNTINTIFKDVTPLVEPLSLDEAYLDVTENHLNEPLAREIAIWIKRRVHKETGITASAGVGPNKFIAKLASDWNKPNGLVIVPPEKVFQFIEHLPVEKFWGVGPATAKRLKQAGIKTASDIRKSSISKLHDLVGIYCTFLFELAHGEDHRTVDPTPYPKSRGSETTFEKDIISPTHLLKYLKEQAEEIAVGLKELERLGKTITLKIKYSDFTSITRSQTLFHPADDAHSIFKTAEELLYRDTEVGSRPVRLIGLSVGNLITEGQPLQLWLEFPESWH